MKLTRDALIWPIFLVAGAAGYVAAHFDKFPWIAKDYQGLVEMVSVLAVGIGGKLGMSPSPLSAEAKIAQMSGPVQPGAEKDGPTLPPAAVLLLVLLLPAVLQAHVNAALTPGAVRPLSRAQVCATKWGLDVRHVSAATRAKVFAAYGIPPTSRGAYIIDHLVPRELAGADEVGNLWPQPQKAAKVKDRVENALHVAVCAAHPTVTLEAAQQRMRAWPSE